jgi:hypothetical protein
MECRRCWSFDSVTGTRSTWRTTSTTGDIPRVHTTLGVAAIDAPQEEFDALLASARRAHLPSSSARPMIERFGHLPASSLIIDRLDGHRWGVPRNYIDRATASGPTLVEARDAFMTLGHIAGPRDERGDCPTSPRGDIYGLV